MTEKVQHLINAVRRLGHYPSENENPTLARALRQAKAVAFLQLADEAELDMFKFRTLMEKCRSADEERWLEDHPAAQRACNEATLSWARSLTTDSIAEHEPSKRRIYHKGTLGWRSCDILGSMRSFLHIPVAGGADAALALQVLGFSIPQFLGCCPVFGISRSFFTFIVQPEDFDFDAAIWAAAATIAEPFQGYFAGLCDERTKISPSLSSD